MFFFKRKKIMAADFFKNSVWSLNSEFLSSTLYLLYLICPIFTCVDPDPYSEYGL